MAQSYEALALQIEARGQQLLLEADSERLARQLKPERTSLAGAAPARPPRGGPSLVLRVRRVLGLAPPRTVEADG